MPTSTWTKDDTPEEKKSILRPKEHDKGKALAATKKVRSVAAKCDDYGASRFIYYFTHALDTSKGQTKKKELEDLEASLENGYICRKAIKDNNNDWLYVGRRSEILNKKEAVGWICATRA